MGYPEPPADQRRPGLGTGVPRPRQDGHYAAKPGPSGGSNDPLHLGPPAPGPLLRSTAGAGDLGDLLGRTVLAARTQQICRAHGLMPAAGSGLSRSYVARDRGIEVTADQRGTVVAVFLHFDAADGFTPYHGEIPGGAGSIPRRAGLWASLGRPDESGGPFHVEHLGDYGPWDKWLLPRYVFNAQYALDGENLYRVTLSLPDRAPSRAA